MLYWLLSAEALQLRTLRAIREARTPLGAEARAPSADRALPLAYDADGRTAVISVAGVLTPAPDMMAEIYGEPNTTYPELQSALRTALDDGKIKAIRWEIDSPGGAVDGLFDLLEDIKDARAEKKMSVLARNAHSAAYGIAAAVGNIIAASRAASFGSVGVATSGFVSGGLCGKVVEMASSNAPEKRPDIETPEGRASVVAYLDQIEEQFFDAIAAGRGISRDAVAQGYGRGASVLAPRAQSMGMIDGVKKRKKYARGAGASATALDEESPGLDGLGPLAYARETMSAQAEVRSDEQEPAAQAALPPAAEATPAPAAASADAGLSAEERAELEAFRAEKAEREAAERRSLVTELVALNAETPATAWVNGAPVARLAAEPLPELRARVAALRSVPRATPGHSAPVPGAGPVGEEALADFERADAAKIKDPEARARFIAKRLARKNKDHG